MMLTQEQTKVITDTLHFFFCSKTTEVREEREKERKGGKGEKREERRNATSSFFLISYSVTCGWFFILRQ